MKCSNFILLHIERGPDFPAPLIEESIFAPLYILEEANIFEEEITERGKTRQKWCVSHLLWNFDFC